MLFTLPDHDTLYAALLARDSAYDGRAFVCVSSTGVFCRMTCPARKPRRENCTFHDQIATCLAAGFRPCKRCKPLAHAGEDDPAVRRLLTALEADPSRRWRECDITALGLDPSTVRRSFKRLFGVTFLDMARQQRIGAGFTALAQGDRVIDAQTDAGFDSPQAFRDAFHRRIGLPPAALRRNGRIGIDWIDSPLGPLIVAADNTHLHLLEFIDRKALPAEMRKLAQLARGDIGFGRSATTDRAERALGHYFAKESAAFDIPLALHGTPFMQKVWRALQTIPPGETRSYAALAQDIGQPNATRAVARANGANQIAILIPCHRVIGADGTLTGYGGGLWRKDKLISIENAYARQRTLS